MSLFVGALLASASPWDLTVRAQGLAPVISSFSPLSDTNGAPVTIRGDNLVNVTKVTFNGFDASFTEFSPTRLFVTVPANASTGPIAVRTTAGETISAEPFTV